MNRKVLDIKEGSSEPCSKVITWFKHDPLTPSQLWYTDLTGCIFSALTGFVFEAKGINNFTAYSSIYMRLLSPLDVTGNDGNYNAATIGHFEFTNSQFKF